MPPETLSQKLQTLTGNPWDLVRKSLSLHQHSLKIIYLRGLVNEERIDQAVIGPLQGFLVNTSDGDLFSANDFLSTFLTATKTRTLHNPDQAIRLLLEGWILLASNESMLIPAVYLPG